MVAAPLLEGTLCRRRGFKNRVFRVPRNQGHMSPVTNQIFIAWAHPAPRAGCLCADVGYQAPWRAKLAACRLERTVTDEECR